MDLDGVRTLFEQWGDVTAEPLDVTYEPTSAAGLPALWAHPAGATKTHALLCLHGGGYALGSVHSHRKLYGHFARQIGCPALILEYRRAPEHIHPAQVEDCVAAYAWLIDEMGLMPAHIALIGDSAGGALAISGVLHAHATKRPLPAAIIAMAPYLDTEARGASYSTNAGRDLLGSREATLQFMPVFLGPGGNPHDPLANPLHANLHDLPPILLQTGEYDVLLDDSCAFARQAKAARVEVSIEIAPAMQHVFQIMAGNHPVADEAIARAAAWLRPKLGLLKNG